MFWILISYELASVTAWTLSHEATDLKTLIQEHNRFIELFLRGMSDMFRSDEGLKLLTTFVMIRESSRFCWCS